MRLSFRLPTIEWRQLPTLGVETGRGWLRQWRKQARGMAGWALFCAVMFVFFTWMSLPGRAIAWRISHELKQRGYVVDVEDVSISPFGGFTLENVSWTFQPSRPDEVPSKFVVEELDVDFSVLSYMFGGIDVEIEGTLDEGTFSVSYDADEESTEIEAHITDVPLYAVPKLRQSLNAPTFGIFALDLNLAMPENKFESAHGEIAISCTACRVGDGETPLYIPGTRGLEKGVTIPEIDLGTLAGKFVVENGTAKAEAFETTSADLSFNASGTIKLKDPFAKSTFDLMLKVLLTEALQQRSETLRFMMQTASKTTKLDPPEEGWLGYRVSGRLTSPRFAGAKSKTADERLRERRERSMKSAEERRRKLEERKKKKSATETVPSESADGEDSPGITPEAGLPQPSAPPMVPPPLPPPAEAPPVIPAAPLPVPTGELPPAVDPTAIPPAVQLPPVEIPQPAREQPAELGQPPVGQPPVEGEPPPSP